MRNRKRILVGVFLAALVLVPVLEGAHDHGDLDRGAACVVCVVAHHAPGANAPILGVDAPGLAIVDFDVVLRLPHAEPHPFASASRAPPVHRETLGA